VAKEVAAAGGAAEVVEEEVVAVGEDFHRRHWMLNSMRIWAKMPQKPDSILSWKCILVETS